MKRSLYIPGTLHNKQFNLVRRITASNFRLRKFQRIKRTACRQVIDSLEDGTFYNRTSAFRLSNEEMTERWQKLKNRMK